MAFVNSHYSDEDPPFDLEREWALHKHRRMELKRAMTRKQMLE